MTFLDELAAIHPDDHTREFWEHCAKHELRFQCCRDCGAYRFPPLSGCRHCGSTQTQWIRVSGRSQVFSYTTVAHPALPQLKDHVPYSVVVVEFDDAPGVRMVSNVLDAAPEEVHVGMALELVWDEPRPGVVLPRFRPASSGMA